MPAFTSRLGLIKPAGGETVNVTDLNNNFDAIDLMAAGAFVCTSTTRPTGATRYTGQVIFETDSKRVLIWDGSAWNAIPYRYFGYAQFAIGNTSSVSVASMLAFTKIYPRPYPRLFNVQFDCGFGLSTASASALINLGFNDTTDGTPTAAAGADHVITTNTIQAKMANDNLDINMTAQFTLAANAPATVIAYNNAPSAGTITPRDRAGRSLSVYGTELGTSDSSDAAGWPGS